MEKGDNNYWTGSSPAQGKNWQTRKAQQEEYRRQLDEQIQQRKRIENGTSVDNARQTSNLQTRSNGVDPVSHLMPWATSFDKPAVGGVRMTNSNRNLPAKTADSPRKRDGLQERNSNDGVGESMRRLMPWSISDGKDDGKMRRDNGPVINERRMSIDENLQPKSSTSSRSSSPRNRYPSEEGYPFGTHVYHDGQETPLNLDGVKISDDTDSVSKAKVTAAMARPAAGIHHGANSMGPPQAFMQTQHGADGPGYTVVPPYQTYNEQSSQRGNHRHQKSSIMMPPAGFPHDDENNYVSGGNRSMGVTENFLIGGPGVTADKQVSMRRHVSQKSEDGPSQSQMKCSYREELQKQIDAKKKLEEERRQQERQEEEMLQKRVQEDHERMQREQEEEQRRRKNKEDEIRSKEQDILRRTEEVQRKEEERRKHFKEEQRKLRLKETISQTDILKPNAVLENPYDSTPIPKFGLNVEDVPEPKLPDLPTDSDTCDKEFFDGNLDMVEPPLPYQNSVDTSNDYNNNNNAVVEVSKSAEACSFSAKALDPFSQFSSGDNCDSARCSKSFSVDDVKLQASLRDNATNRSTNHEHREGLEYLAQLREALITEKEKVDHRIRERSKKRNSFTISK